MESVIFFFVEHDGMNSSGRVLHQTASVQSYSHAVKRAAERVNVKR